MIPHFFGNIEFSASITLPGVTRDFDSFAEAANEAGRSRIYGGIHFEFSNQDGLALGRDVGDGVLDVFHSTYDTGKCDWLLI